MANGLDLSRYEQKVERNPYRIFWSSSLDRGLDTLLYLFDFIKKEIPELELHVFYGMFNLEAAAKQRNNPAELKMIEEIKEGLKKPGVFYHDRIGQKELAVEQMKSSLWAYSTDFTETFSISAIEAQAAGCPVIASNYAGLQTTLGDSGILIGNGTQGQSFTKEYREEFVRRCVELLTDKEKWQYWSDRGYKNIKKYTWANCALKWKELFEE
jgi:glycosyltransferase involved in cell wall biosynthesis